MDIGWKLIVADLHAYLATGVDPGRHFQQWRDFGADATPGPGGVWIGPPRPGSMADRLELREGDLLVGLGGAAVTDLTDLVSVVRATVDQPGPPAAACIRGGRLFDLSPTG
jgi:S1-C subfamily serine protease